MNKGIRLLSSLTALFAMGSAGAVVVVPPSCPASPQVADVNPETGHYFEVYACPGITWDDAKARADGKSLEGVPGHLATITSKSEDVWVDNLRRSAGLVAPEAWVGGLQAPGSDVGKNWRWDNGEGAIATFAEPLPSYSNWLPGEPNDNTGPASENYLAIGLSDRFGWNDEGALGNIGGFVVEYDLPRAAACDGPTCQTINGQTLILPPGSFAEGDTINFNAFEFTDPRVASGKCGVDPLRLFEDPADGKEPLEFPAYLCGSPRFVVVVVDARKENGTPLSVRQGGVFIENDTEIVLPDNDIKVCKDTKGPIVPAPGEDPQLQDVIVYQTSDPARMLENLAGNRSQDPQLEGTAGEFTNSCGSSRGTGKETSYFVVGMHIDFGASASTVEGRHDRFVALTRYKLTLLQQSVILAKSAGALKNGDTTKMSAQLDNAVKKLDRGDPSGALVHVAKFLKFVDAAVYTPPLAINDNDPVLGNNYNGEHLMRGRNIEFTLRVKVIPNAP